MGGVGPQIGLIARPLTLHSKFSSSAFISKRGVASFPKRIHECLLLWTPEDFRATPVLCDEGGSNNGWSVRYSMPSLHEPTDLYHRKVCGWQFGSLFIENCWSAPADFLEIKSRMRSEGLLDGLAGFVKECLARDLYLLILLDESTAEYPVDVIPLLIRLLSSRDIMVARVCIFDQEVDSKRGRESVRHVYYLPVISGEFRLSPQFQVLSIIILIVVNYRSSITPYSISQIISNTPEINIVLKAMNIPCSHEAVRKRTVRALTLLRRLCLVEVSEVSGRKLYSPSMLGAHLIRLLTDFPQIAELTQFHGIEFRDFLRRIGSEGMPELGGQGYV